MSKPRVILPLALAGAIFLGGSIASAQNYPTKTIRIVTSAVGGGNDFMSRMIAQGISGPLGQPVVVENRPGTPIMAEVVAHASADGYTLLFASTGLWILPLIQQVSYDPIRDFAPVSMIDRAPNILVVHPSLAVNSVKDLIAYAKANPGKLNYSSGGIGTSAHLAAELFKSMAGVNIVGLSYQGSGPQLNALISNEVQITFAQATAVTQHLKAGRMKALAVGSAEPSPLLPGMVTIAASGLPGFEAGSTDGVFVRAGTPASVIVRLNQEIVRFINQPEVKERFQNTGVEMIGSSPEYFAAAIKSEIGRMGKVIKDAGLRVN